MPHRARLRSGKLVDPSRSVFPLLSGPSFPLVLAGNATANLTRNLWAFTIIFCGHFPEGTHEFTEAQAESETRGEWHHRQLLGSANLSGGKLFHILAGNLSHQIEHHLLPDLPAHRYAEISVEVHDVTREIGDWATDLFEIRDAARRAQADTDARSERPGSRP